jgi:hypothetical protein
MQLMFNNLAFQQHPEFFFTSSFLLAVLADSFVYAPPPVLAGFKVFSF